MPVQVQTEDFDLTTEIGKFRSSSRKIGAVVTFIGTVRDLNDGASVAEMTLEHYPGMTEKSLEDIVAQAKARWNIFDALVIHRVGPLKPLDQIVLVATSSAHRGEAFQACEFIIDYLKTLAPFWKKEQTPEGARWVDARVTDDVAMEKWRQDPNGDTGDSGDAGDSGGKKQGQSDASGARPDKHSPATASGPAKENPGEQESRQ